LVERLGFDFTIEKSDLESDILIWFLLIRIIVFHTLNFS
jgi:hypothetical protein